MTPTRVRFAGNSVGIRGSTRKSTNPRRRSDSRISAGAYGRNRYSRASTAAVGPGRTPTFRNRPPGRSRRGQAADRRVEGSVLEGRAYQHDVETLRDERQGLAAVEPGQDVRGPKIALRDDEAAPDGTEAPGASARGSPASGDRCRTRPLRIRGSGRGTRAPGSRFPPRRRAPAPAQASASRPDRETVRVPA